MIEKIAGPFAGFHVAVCVRETNEPDGNAFIASYKICRERPTNYATAKPVRTNEVAGSSSTLLEAQEIAVQLARLQIGVLLRRRGASVPPESDVQSDPPMYQPTTPCPLPTR